MPIPEGDLEWAFATISGHSRLRRVLVLSRKWGLSDRKITISWEKHAFIAGMWYHARYGVNCTEQEMIHFRNGKELRKKLQKQQENPTG